MMRTCFLIFIIRSISFCQGPVITVTGPDSEKLPFVVISCSDTIIFPNDDGAIHLRSNDTCVCSHLGYDYQLLITNSVRDIITLKKQTIPLDSIQIVGKKLTELEAIGPFSASRVSLKPNHTHGINLSRGTILTYVPRGNVVGTIQNAVVYLTEIYPEVLFRIRILAAEDSNTLGEEILNDHVYFDSKSYTARINLSAYNIAIPRNGAFVCLEWRNLDDMKNNKLWSLDEGQFFRIAMSRRRKLSKYSSYLTSKVDHGIGNPINALNSEYYFIGTPMVGLEVD